MNDIDSEDISPPEPPDRSDDRIELLLRATGRRPVVPADRADRVKTAVRAHWRAETRRRWRRLRLWPAVAVATAATVVAAVGVGIWQRVGPSPGSEAAARVERVVHSAWSRPASGAAGTSPSVLRSGDEIEVGSELATEGAGRLAIRMASGHSLRLDAGTHLRVLSERVIALDRGAVYVDSRGPSGAAVGSVEIRTPLGSIRDIGTQFEARLRNASLHVLVREGTISLDGRDSALEVAAGHALEISDEGRTVRPELTASAPEWAWIGEITPMMQIEGRSLREFLDWMVRERGLRLRFASDVLAESASEATLKGSIDGMTLDQALESVLTTCRMRHRIQQDALFVESLDESTGPS